MDGRTDVWTDNYTLLRAVNLVVPTSCSRIMGYLQLRSGLRTVVRHRCHVELDTFFHKSVGFAEIMILSVNIDEIFF